MMTLVDLAADGFPIAVQGGNGGRTAAWGAVEDGLSPTVVAFFVPPGF